MFSGDKGRFGEESDDDMRDADVRKAIRQTLKSIHASDEQTRIVEEMPVWSGSARIDVAVINGLLSGYELKSDRDTLERLPLQVEIYGKVFDNVTLVVGSKHAKRAFDLVPIWWGVIVARQRGEDVSLSDERATSQNLEQDPAIFAELLCKSETLDLLERYDLARGWRSKSIREIHARLADRLPFEILKKEVRQTMKNRPDWLGQNRPG